MQRCLAGLLAIDPAVDARRAYAPIAELVSSRAWQSTEPTDAASTSLRSPALRA